MAVALLDRWTFKRGLQDSERWLLAKNAISGLTSGLGRRDDDSVFLRSSSALVLCAVVERDLVHPFLRFRDYRRILASALRVLDRENDLRGFVPGKGWAHILAHLADLLDALAKSPHMESKDLQRVLKAMAKRLLKPTPTILSYGEPVRLARATMTLLDRGIVPAPFIQAWVASLSRSAGGRPWSEVDDHPGDVSARTNIALFLSALLIVPTRQGTGGSRARVARLALRALRQITERF
ncbi:MAG: DUF2785 domain-containing protein [Thermoplasmata archaeon]